MTEESSPTISHLSVAMTTVRLDGRWTTGAYTVTSSFSGYFECAAVVIGAIGTAANALILYALVASGQHKKHLLICNQNVFDLCSCLLLVITFIVRLCDVQSKGTAGYWLCVLLSSDGLLWCPLIGSIVNLATITVDRYLKVVHPACSKRWLRKWTIYSVIAAEWIGSIVYNMAYMFPTTAVVDGVCYPYAFWTSDEARLAHDVWYFVSFFVVVLFIFIFCYGRILIVIRRRADAMAGHDAASPGSAPQTQLNQIQ